MPEYDFPPIPPQSEPQDVTFDLSGTPASQVLIGGRVDGDANRRFSLKAGGDLSIGDASGNVSFFWDNANLFTLMQGNVGKQLRLGFDGSNFSDFQVNSSGVLGIIPSGNRFRFLNGLSNQILEIYATTDSNTNPVNLERFSVGFSGNTCFLRTTQGGTGIARNLNIGTFGSADVLIGANQTSLATWIFTTANHFTAGTDNAFDIGAAGASRPRSIYWGTQAFGPNGSQSVPAFSFAGSTGSGLYVDTSFGATGISYGGTAGLYVGSGGIYLGTNTINFASAINTAADTTMTRDGAADVIAMKRSSNAQEFRIYGTTTGSKYLSLKHDGTSCLITQQAGLGQIAFGTAAKATTDTAGYVCIPSCAGAPTGVPASIPTGQIPYQIDSTNKKLYAYIGGAWTKAQASGVDVIFA
jgi:hypothetical protein